MSETWYRAIPLSTHPRIVPVVIERYNDNSVWVWEKRWGQPELRRHSRDIYFPTFNAARDHLMDYYSGEITKARAAVDYYQGILGTVFKMDIEDTTTDTLEGRV